MVAVPWSLHRDAVPRCSSRGVHPRPEADEHGEFLAGPSLASRGDTVAMKWLVGIDLKPDCAGALAWLSWCHAWTGEPPDALALHAVEWPAVEAYPSPELEVVQEGVQSFLHERGHALEARVVEGREPADALAHAMSLHGADILVIGRRASRDGDDLVRLGGVARRLLRQLPTPLVVCPPDLRAQDVPEGPIMLAIQPGSRFEQALRFARQLSVSLRRPLIAVSAVPPAFPTGVTYLPTPRYDGGRRDQALAHLQDWLATMEMPDVETRVEEGPTVSTLWRIAEDEGACLIVTGSRLLTVSERFTRSSVGTTLASVARVPVAVVPPW